MSILNEQLRYYRESPNQDFSKPTQKNCDLHKDPRKNIFDPCNPRENYNPRKMLTHVKIIFTHVTHATQ